jgi:ABC-type uncharacterized transport system fused permease/ATPase subunit
MAAGDHGAARRMLFLPQRSYLPIGTLADALSYPDAGNAHSREALVNVCCARRGSAC